MDTTLNFLTSRIGVDNTIADFFLNKPVPKDNLYWKGKQTYLPAKLGYVFIPIFCDMLYRIGVDKSELLSKKYVGVIEKILHSAAKEESKGIDFKQHEQECQTIVGFFNVGKAKIKSLEEELLRQVNNGFLEGHPALHRANSYLYSLLVLESIEEQLPEIIKVWLSLICLFLAFDDITDFEQDKVDSDDNFLLEGGQDYKENILDGYNFMNECLSIIANYNEQLSQYFNNKLKILISTSLTKLFI